MTTTTISVLPLSASTDGRNIKVTATVVGSATTIHTGSSSTANTDCIQLYATNTSTVPCLLKLWWGGVTDPDDSIPILIPAQSGDTILTSSARILVGNATPLIVKASADTANVINIGGSVQRVNVV